MTTGEDSEGFGALRRFSVRGRARIRTGPVTGIQRDPFQAQQTPRTTVSHSNTNAGLGSENSLVSHLVVAVGQTRRPANFCHDVPTTTGEAESNRSRQGLADAHEASCDVGLWSEAAALSRIDKGLGLSDSHRHTRVRRRRGALEGGRAPGLSPLSARGPGK